MNESKVCSSRRIRTFIFEKHIFNKTDVTISSLGAAHIL